MLRIDVPGYGSLELEHLVLDVNGTLTDRGALIDGVASRIARIGETLTPRLVSADTFGTLEAVARELGVVAGRAATGADKLRLLDELGPRRCAVVGNGRNDVAVLAAAALGIAVLGPEGASAQALAAADVVCGSILEALDLLLDPQALRATLRG